MQNAPHEKLPAPRVIDLGDYRTPNAIVLSGRTKGQDLRQRLDLASEDTKPAPVLIRVPRAIVSLNSSFFLGLFTGSIRLLRDKFDGKYTFECSSLVREDIEKGKREAINEANPLAQK